MPPDDFNWREFKERLDIVFRWHHSRGHHVAVVLLDRVYDDWQKGKRLIRMIEALKEVDMDTIDICNTEYV